MDLITLSSPVSIGVPVVSSRIYTNALSPRADGGWDYINQSYHFNDANPTEWLVMNLNTGDYHVDLGSALFYANVNYNQAQFKNQLRAPNGRIFFVGFKNHVWYFDPVDRHVHELPQVPSIGKANGDQNVYHAVFDQTGKAIYGGTQDNVNSGLPEVWVLDPVTLTVRVLCRVGSNLHASGVPHYAYRMWADTSGATPWLYVLVGEDVWDVVAVNLVTGVQTVIATSTVVPWADFQIKPEGLTARLYTNYQGTNQTIQQMWLVDGQAYPYTSGYSPASLPFTPRNVTQYNNPVVNQPDIDESLGVKRLRWRPHGSTGPYMELDYQLQYPVPVNIESAVPLADGTVLGDVDQYQGFFRYDPSKNTFVYYGPFPGVTEGLGRIVIDGKLYITGYPNAPLYCFDPALPWDGSTNPQLLGYYSDGTTMSGVKHGEFLAYSEAVDRMFMVGTRQRTGVGTGIGSYDFATKAFAGNYAGDLHWYYPSGLCVLDDCGLIVYSGNIQADSSFPNQTPTTATLFIYDMSCKLQRQIVVKPGILDTGYIFKTPVTGVVTGLSIGAKALYRIDVFSGQLIQWVDLPSAPGQCCVDPSGIIWTVLGNTLTSIDPVTLAMNSHTIYPTLPTRLAWSADGGTLYTSIGPTLFAQTKTMLAARRARITQMPNLSSALSIV